MTRLHTSRARLMSRLPALLAVWLLSTALAAAEPVRLIFDTDMQTDCDDAGALAVLHALADNGEVEILATMVSALHPWAAACTDAINTYYGRPDLPLGTLKGTTGVNMASRYAKDVAAAFPQDTGSSQHAADATAVYRRILAQESGRNIVILTVGYMTNLAKLLHSPADEISPLTGAELIAQKVKLWVCMGGNFPVDDARDNVNFTREPASVVDCAQRWPGPIVFVGREIGHAMRAGAMLAGTPEHNPVRRSYELYFGGTAKDRHCADPAAVLFAVRGLRDYWDIQTAGSMNVRPNASFEWVKTPDLDQAYLLEKMSPKAIQKELEDLMIQPPRAVR